MKKYTKHHKTTELESILKHSSQDNLKDIVDQLEEITFIEYFELLLVKYKAKKSDVIANTLLDRTYAYQILQGKKLGGKDKIIQFSLGIHCTLDECNKLLQLTNNGKLYAKHKRDAVLIHAIEKKLNVFETNNLLYDYDMDLLE
ncbi:hypothetical protein M2475_001269 [Breznakia sp. PF5-3]|uniref:hypothetical protein n=1 Tax=unclassified Breznakia TaxID=2623764 RepID=UPI00240550A9|nr:MULTISPECIES: hypothetical protein [unclassified Breznakia]MDF9824733.1 hypothetical protein [Breznakia sp. PM6-1]MDF9835700.1 hypothetical protein [Breznakia sp. PF5-3]MDF9837749.1 hypothetical protein [Breznakia sp. PFB2-8]MDF9859710.1 hypothetical protein [Breznakia sp. PH5-24]